MAAPGCAAMLFARPLPGVASQPSGLGTSSRSRTPLRPFAMSTATTKTFRTCRRCKQQFDPAENHSGACNYHSALWTGGEISKVGVIKRRLTRDQDCYSEFIAIC